jgi:ribA/ribD-fused uncharacterized protein
MEHAKVSEVGKPLITSFSGTYAFLSNFHPCEIRFAGIGYHSVEAAYQASKTLDLDIRRTWFADCRNPGQAKKMGQKLKIRPDWDQIKLKIMLRLLRKKFAIPELRDQLLSTKNAELIESNWWGDRFWGVCRGTGENNLGKLLMQVREEN